MSACSFSSVDEVTHALLERGDVAKLRIERGASDDLAPAFLAYANQLNQTGTRARIVCVDDVAAQRFRTSLEAYPALGADAVVTMRELCLSLAADERVRAAMGREARLLNDNEHDVLLEDLKVSGIKPRRLREMLKFFYKSISDCFSEEPGWLVTNEEQMVFAILEENLDVRRALLPCELPGRVYHGLVDAGAEVEPLVLLVDDFGTLSKAAQRLVQHVAGAGLVVAGASTEARNAEEPYPWIEGFASFADATGADAWTLETGAGAPVGACIVCPDPYAEFACVADQVKARLDAGMAPHDVLVAVPNGTWAAKMVEALEARGIAAVRDGGAGRLKGDPRYAEKCADLKLAAFLQLILDPHDFTALRSWMGMGDWLLRSDAFLELMAYARDHEMTVPEAVAALRAMDDEARGMNVFGKFDAPLDELDELRRACEGIGRDEAVLLFERHGMPLAPRMVALLGDDPARADLENLARNAFAGEGASGGAGADADVDAVSVVPYRSCHGHFARVTFVTGLVNGFLPRLDAVDDKYTIDHRAVALERERVLFDDVCATATDEVVCTRFERDRLENTGVLDMQTARVFIKNGIRYASVVPSAFVS